MFYLDLFSALDRRKVEYALKQSSARPIDLADIEHLERLQNP